MKDYWACKDCEAPITQEWDLCEDCHSDWIGWLASERGRTPDIDASRPTPL